MIVFHTHCKLYSMIFLFHDENNLFFETSKIISMNHCVWGACLLYGFQDLYVPLYFKATATMKIVEDEI